MLSTAVFGLVLVRRPPRVGHQVTVDSIDDDGRENDLQFVLLYLEDFAFDLSASWKHGLSVHLDGPCKAGLKGITPVILVAGEGLVDGCGDLGAFRQSDKAEWLRRACGVSRRSRVC